MRKFLLLFSITGLLLAASCAGQTAAPAKVENKAPGTPAAAPPAPTATAKDDAPRISLADAKKAFDDGTAVFIDTHSKEQYDTQHIKGAINISLSDLAAKADTIPKGKKIIAYCS